MTKRTAQYVASKHGQPAKYVLQENGEYAGELNIPNVLGGDRKLGSAPQGVCKKFNNANKAILDAALTAWEVNGSKPKKGLFFS